VTSDKPVPSTRRRRLFRLVAAVLLPVVTLAVLEGGLRLGGFEHSPATSFFRFGNPERLIAENDQPGPSVSDPVIFWRMRPGWRTEDGRYHVRRSGFRTPDFEAHKRPRSTRIACLGDSSVFGMGVGENETWASRLEDGLRSRLETDAVDVINLGVPGYTVFQGGVLMQQTGRDLELDLVVVAFGGFNDWVPAVGYRDSRQGRLKWWQSLRVVQLILWARGGEEPAQGAATADAAMEALKVLDTRAYEGERRVPLDEFERLLGKLAADATDRGARVVLLASALPAATLERNPMATRYAEAVRRVAVGGHYALVDGPALFAASGLTDGDLFGDFCHPTSRGHELLAEAVLTATGLATD